MCKHYLNVLLCLFIYLILFLLEPYRILHCNGFTDLQLGRRFKKLYFIETYTIEMMHHAAFHNFCQLDLNFDKQYLKFALNHIKARI